jgi:hypothetical protein
MNLKIALPAAALAVGLLGIGFGTAEALSTTAIPPNTIHGCVAGTARSLEHVYTDASKGTTCPSGELRVVFPKGATTAGPTGLDTVIVQAVNSAIAACPSSHPYVLGGGFTGGVNVQSSQPFQHGGATGQEQGWATVQATSTYAVCAK